MRKTHQDHQNVPMQPICHCDPPPGQEFHTVVRPRPDSLRKCRVRTERRVLRDPVVVHERHALKPFFGSGVSFQSLQPSRLPHPPPNFSSRQVGHSLSASLSFPELDFWCFRVCPCVQKKVDSRQSPPVSLIPNHEGRIGKERETHMPQVRGRQAVRRGDEQFLPQLFERDLITGCQVDSAFVTRKAFHGVLEIGLVFEVHRLREHDDLIVREVIEDTEAQLVVMFVEVSEVAAPVKDQDSSLKRHPGGERTCRLLFVVIPCDVYC
mmetsp:Transcript_53980/g.105550  ORF Transcript_53980/g.105550 Transcript_53980/m.105550 type:complete len:266 (-) Transcript_53980:209-1006(-)